MALEEKRVPHEVLIRFEDGKIKGAHLEFLDLVLRDGVVIHQATTGAIPIALGESEGFPMADVAAIINIASLKASIAAVADVNAKNQELEAAKLEASLSAETATKATAENESLRSALLTARMEVANLSEKGQSK